jgi:hypothetical protein
VCLRGCSPSSRARAVSAASRMTPSPSRSSCMFGWRISSIVDGPTNTKDPIRTPSLGNPRGRYSRVFHPSIDGTRPPVDCENRDGASRPEPAALEPRWLAEIVKAKQSRGGRPTDFTQCPSTFGVFNASCVAARDTVAEVHSLDRGPRQHVGSSTGFSIFLLTGLCRGPLGDSKQPLVQLSTTQLKLEIR